MHHTIQEYLEHTARECPDKLAFGDADKGVTFSQFREAARRLSCFLGGKGFSWRPVAVFMDKKVECLEAMIGVAYSGIFYTVLDIHMPQARIHKITEVSCSQLPLLPTRPMPRMPRPWPMAPR